MSRKEIRSPYQFCENTAKIYRAYKVSTTGSTSEIEQEISFAWDEDIIISFTPHLVP
jgi:N-acetyl-gamma-glutamyl-phosphate reductase